MRMHTFESFHRLDLDDDAFLHDQIDAMTMQNLAAIDDRHHALAFVLQLSVLQLEPQGFVVDAFEKARTERPVHLERAANRAVDDLLDLRRERTGNPSQHSHSPNFSGLRAPSCYFVTFVFLVVTLSTVSR